MDKSRERLELYKQRYYFELERKDRLGSMITIPSGIATLLFGTLTYLLSKTSLIPTRALGILFFLAVVLLFFFLVIAVYFLILSIYGYTYCYMPSSEIIEDYWNELANYYNQYIEVKGDEYSHFINYLIETYCECNKNNILNNERKASLIFKANKFIVLALIAAMVASFTLYIGTINELFKLTAPILSIFK